MPSPNYIVIGGVGTPVGGPALAVPADVTLGTITADYIWDSSSQSKTRRATALRLKIPYTPPSGWIGIGVHVYIEYPDSSAGALFKLDGTTPLDGTKQLGGAFTPTDVARIPADGTNVAVIDDLAVPKEHVSIRVYALAYSMNAEAKLVRANQTSPSPSAVVAVDPPTVFVSGEEYSGNVTGFAATSRYVINGAGQKTLEIDTSWTRPNDPKWQGVKIVLVRDQPYTLTGIVPGSSQQSFVNQFPVVVEADHIRCLSVDVDGNTNSYVPGVTPEVEITLNPPALGSAGSEYTVSVSGVAANVYYLQSKDGVEMYGFKGTLSPPSLAVNPEFGGVALILRDEAGLITDSTLGLTGQSDTTFSTGPWPLNGVQPTWDLYFVSYDVNNKQNTLVPGGATPVVTGLHPVAQTAGSLKGDRIAGGTVPLAAFASTIRPVALASADPSLPDSNYPAGTLLYNTTTHVLKKVNSSGNAWELAVNGGTDVIANSITGGQIQAGSISSTELNSVEIKVGGGSGKPGQFGVYDTFNTLVGWIGTNGGNVGAWFKTLRIGGSSYASGIIQADAAGNVSIAGATFTLNKNGLTVSVDAGVNGVGTYGLQVKENSSGDYLSLRPHSLDFNSGGSGGSGGSFSSPVSVSGATISMVTHELFLAQSLAGSATAGSLALPSNPVGFVTVKAGFGISYKIPLYNL